MNEAHGRHNAFHRGHISAGSEAIKPSGPAGHRSSGLAERVLGSRTAASLLPSVQRIGAIAVLAGLAHNGCAEWASRRPQHGFAPDAVAPPPPGSVLARLLGGRHALITGELVIRTMIATARADGRIDASEANRLRHVLYLSGLQNEEDLFLFTVLGRPNDLNGLVRSVASFELASLLWMAARVTIDLANDLEITFIECFAKRLGLDPALAAHLEATAANVLLEWRQIA